MARQVRLVIVHQNRLFRECLVSVLTESRFKVTNADYTDRDILKKIVATRPDVVLIDLNLPKNLTIQLTQQIRRRVDGAKVLLLVPANSEQEIIEAVEAGAHGCVQAESSLEHLTEAIEAVSSGATFCSPQIVQSMFGQPAKLGQESRWCERVESAVLTAREIEVLGLIGEGFSNKQIASELSLSLYTVKNHVHNILEKLRVQDRFEAVEYAYERRWLRELHS